MQKSSKKPKLIKKIPLRLLLVIPFVLQVFASVGLVGYFSFVRGQKAVNNLANQLMDKTSQQLDGHLDSYLALPLQISQMNLNAIAAGNLDITNRVESERYFWQQAQAFKDITYVGYSLNDGTEVGADRISEIVLSLRNFSRLNEAHFKEADIHEGIDNTLMILQNRLKAKPHRPEIEVIKQYIELPLIKCYAGQLNQVFMNLLSNAIDALEESFSQHKTKLTITISTHTIDSMLLISIVDNGDGISKDIQHKLFDPFFTTKPVGKGTGLGLSISYQIVVEKHCGRLWCDSIPGQGTKFVIEIPIN